MEESMHILVIKNFLGDIVITVEVHTDFNFVPEESNFGCIQIESCSASNKETVFWDNINFFINAPKKEIKEECLPELKEKGLYEKGVFKLLQRMLKPFIEMGYLKVNPGEDY